MPFVMGGEAKVLPCRPQAEPHPKRLSASEAPSVVMSLPQTVRGLFVYYG